MSPELSTGPYVPTLARLALALAIGLFIGIERERRQKVAGVRTFAFAAVLGAVGGLLGEHFGLLAIGLLGVLVVLLNLDTLWSGEGRRDHHLRHAAGHRLRGAARRPGPHLHPHPGGHRDRRAAGLEGAARRLQPCPHRVRAILAFVVYPVLPPGTLDPWGLIDPREAWITVILIAALGFANYVLLKLRRTPR